MGCEPFHMGLCLWESACCESLSRLRRQLPLAREPLRAVPIPSGMEGENMGTVHALTAAARRPSCARYRRLVRRTYSLFTLHYSLKTPGIGGLEKSLFARGGNYFLGDRRKRTFWGIEKSCLCRAGRSFSLEAIMADIKNSGILYVFPVFHSAWMAKKISFPAADDLFRVSLVSVCSRGHLCGKSKAGAGNKG